MYCTVIASETVDFWTASNRKSWSRPRPACRQARTISDRARDGKDAAAKPQQKNGAKNQYGKGGPRLRKHHGRDQSMTGKETAVKNCLAHHSGSAPAKRGCGHKEIAPPWMLLLRRGAYCCCAADSLGKHCVQALRIKADHDFFPHDYRRRGTAVVGAHQLKNRLLVRTNIFHLKLNTFLRKVGLSP